MKDPYRLERKDNMIFWIRKWSNGKYHEEKLKEMPIDKLGKLYNKLLFEKCSRV